MNIIGHTNIIKTFTALAQEKKLSHSYLFWGPRRVGKRTVAAMLAEQFEEHAAEDKRPLSDFLLLQPSETNTIGIDAIRALSEFVRIKPAVSPYRMVMIDNAEYLTPEAQNALLKISEEMPQSGLLILIVEHPESLQATLASRFQKLYFSEVPEPEIAAWLHENHACERVKARDIAHRAFGQPGRAYALLHDETYTAMIAEAKRFLSRDGAHGRTYIKDLTGSDDFQLTKFLDALIDVLAAQHASSSKQTEKNIALWHTVLALRKNAEFFNINPRLQMESLYYG